MSGIRKTIGQSRTGQTTGDRGWGLKIYLDTCMWGGTKVHLETAGHDVIWSGDRDEDPGDDEILAIAHHEGRRLVTLDKDFGELAIVHNKPHSGIIHLVNKRTKQQGAFCQHVLEQYQNEIIRGAIATVETDRVRIRSPK